MVGVKPMRWSTRLGMTELKNVSSTRCAEAVAGASRKAAMNTAITPMTAASVDRL